MDFEQVFSQYGPLLSRVAASYEAEPALRDELAQDISLAVWQSLQRYEGRSSIKTYILKVAHNRAVSHVSRQVKQPATDDFEDNSTLFCEEKQSGPGAHAEQAQSRQRLLDAIRVLPIQSRQVITLSLEGLSYDEIADVCGLQRSHVGVLLNRAKTAIKRSLNDE
ncbi:RNA polymerase sigma factor [Salinimonas iocasae]|uniref:Sigma-70 family RNA polymerase sigma factor n=1 Tax=Salinimonas iocasae TaxID=2572577 RepID=A0A5B7YHT0_9ALTE|nr:sigma-70 family RNA polymerase sigma factor [Salinimonas iocasae]QCZ95058.1 sigma-70 family RNA polymerase sigma factor [Salinimonas iocasae]